MITIRVFNVKTTPIFRCFLHKFALLSLIHSLFCWRMLFPQMREHSIYVSRFPLYDKFHFNVFKKFFACFRDLKTLIYLPELFFIQYCCFPKYNPLTISFPIFLIPPYINIPYYSMILIQLRWLQSQLRTEQPHRSSPVQ